MPQLLLNMKTLSTFLLFLIFHGLPYHLYASKTDHYYHAISDPYINFFKGAQEQLKQQSTGLFDYLTGSNKSSNQARPLVQELTGSFESETDMTDPRNIRTSEELIKYFEVPNHQKKRMLQGWCLNGGVEVITNRHWFLCNEIGVTKKVFDERGGLSNPNCRIMKFLWDFCFCPYDYRGWRCHIPVPIEADLEPIVKLNDCKGENSYEYVYDYDGIPPCKIVKPGDTIDLE